MVTKKTSDTSEETAVELPARGAEITDRFLRGIGKVSGDSFEDALNLTEQIYGKIEEFADQMGNGFAILKDKNQLVGVDTVFLRWNWHDGDFGNFVSAAVVTETGGRYIINDGSSGMAAQLREFQNETGRDGGMRARNGLRVSQYTTCPSCNRPRRSTEDECSNTLHNGSVCGDTDTARGQGETFYIDLTS